jgi:hypothetical protein
VNAIFRGDVVSAKTLLIYVLLASLVVAAAGAYEKRDRMRWSVPLAFAEVAPGSRSAYVGGILRLFDRLATTTDEFDEFDARDLNRYMKSINQAAEDEGVPLDAWQEPEPAILSLRSLSNRLPWVVSRDSALRKANQTFDRVDLDGDDVVSDIEVADWKKSLCPAREYWNKRRGPVLCQRGYSFDCRCED